MIFLCPLCGGLDILIIGFIVGCWKWLRKPFEPIIENDSHNIISKQGLRYLDKPEKMKQINSEIEKQQKKNPYRVIIVKRDLSDILKEKIDSMSTEELQEIVNKVEDKNLKGVTVKEYFDRLQNAFNKPFKR